MQFDLQSLLEYCWRNYCFCEAHRCLTGMAPWVVLPKFEVPWEEPKRLYPNTAFGSLPNDGRRY